MNALGLALGLPYGGSAGPGPSGHWLWETGYAMQWETGIYIQID